MKWVVQYCIGCVALQTLHARLGLIVPHLDQLIVRSTDQERAVPCETPNTLIYDSFQQFARVGDTAPFIKKVSVNGSWSHRLTEWILWYSTMLCWVVTGASAWTCQEFLLERKPG